MALRRLIVVLVLVAVAAPASVVLAVPSGADGSEDGITVTTDVVYGEAPDETGDAEVLRLDLYDPTTVPG